MNLDATQRTKYLLKLHETTKLNIEKINVKYKITGNKDRKEAKLELGDLEWVHLRKDRFSDLRKPKLMSHVAWPFKIHENIKDNTYKLKLPSYFRVSLNFNILDLKPYLGEEGGLEWRMTPLQKGENDKDITSLNTLQGPFTRVQAYQLNL